MLWSLVLSSVFVSVGTVNIQQTNDSATESQILEWKTACPSNCKCYSALLSLATHTSHSRQHFTTLDCSNAGLSMLPSSLPNNTEVINISNNNITTLPKLPPAYSLRVLNASNNVIETLDKLAFIQSPELEFLSLRKNKLSQLPTMVFSLADKLSSLDLSANQIQNLSEEIFLPLTYLKSLNLAQNSITTVTAAWFDSLRDLQELDLSNNQIVTVEDQTFKGLVNLNLLNLSNNKIRKIGNNAFTALDNVIVLDLDNNLLQFVPKVPLQTMKRLKKVSLNGNLIHKLHSGDFSLLNVFSLSVSFMPNLEIVDKMAFQNLKLLTNIELHDNPKLIFIDPQAFSVTPALKSLYFHNNQLTALSPRILQNVPSLEQIHLYNNPFRCDCNAFWIRELITEVQEHNSSKPFLNHSEFIKCDYPLNTTGTPVGEVPEEQFPRVCAPTTLPSFHENYTLDLGEELRLECHVFGVPEPTLSWLLPNGTEITTSNVKGDKFEIVDKCVLIIRQLTSLDNGLYACKADNGVGYDISSTKINVTNKPIRLVLFNIGYDYISLSWNGTRHSSLISDYQLHYREVINDISKRPKEIKYRVIPLGPQYKSYTVTNLKSDTGYEFCIVYVYDTEYYKVDCEVYTTKSSIEYHSAVRKIVSEKIIAGVCTALGIVMAIACMVTLVKKFRLHKDYESPYGADETESINIPLENVYQPLSTPLCSSKTSLLSVHTNKTNFED